MKKKFITLALALVLCFSIYPVAYAANGDLSVSAMVAGNMLYAEEVSIDVILAVNDETYGTVRSADNLTGLKPGDEIELIAEASESAYVEFYCWVVYKGQDLLTVATEGVDYSLSDNTAHTTMTILGSGNLKVLAVFKGNIVNLTSSGSQYKPITMRRDVRLVASDDYNNSPGAASGLSGWNNDPGEPLTAEIIMQEYLEDNEAVSEYVLKIHKKSGGFAGSLLADGAHFEFDVGTIVYDIDGFTIIRLPDDFRWDEYCYRIVDEQGNTLKNCKVTFKYPGLAVIDAENGAVRTGGKIYRNGEVARVGVGDRTIEAIPDLGYVFDGWEITGVELSNPLKNPLTFEMSYLVEDITIKAKFVAMTKVAIPEFEYVYDGLEHGPEDTDAYYCTSFGNETYAGEYYAYLTLKDGYVWDLGNNSISIDKQFVTWKITAAEQTARVTDAVSLQAGGNTLDLNTLVTGMKGDIAFTLTSEGGCTLNGNILTSGDMEDTAIVYYRITGENVDGNGEAEYEDMDGTISINIVEDFDNIRVLVGSSDLIQNENYTVNGNVITVTYGVPCKVGYLSNNGKYIAIDAFPLEDQENTYIFTVDNPDVTEVMLVVKGDANGNGKFDGGDITKAKAASLGKVSLGDVRLFAADANGNGYFDGGDITRMKAVSLGKKSFDW